jgi:hypothetical protein
MTEGTDDSERTDPADPDLDEYGRPRAWRRDPTDRMFLKASEAFWPYFERWCASRGLNDFPASPRTVLLFLKSSAVEGETLFRTWKAINRRHEAYYWHTDANPVQLLSTGGVEVKPDGAVMIPPEVTRMLDE